MGSRIKEFIDNTKLFGEVITLLPVSFMNYGAHILAKAFSEKVRYGKNLEKILEKESSKLGLDEKNVHVKFGPNFLDTAEVEKIPNGNYEILLSENYQDAFTLRHELYHIYKKHLEDSSPSVTRLFLRESQSTLYGLFRIKI